jgi:hypothetical protein
MRQDMGRTRIEKLRRLATITKGIAAREGIRRGIHMTAWQKLGMVVPGHATTEEYRGNAGNTTAYLSHTGPM